MLLCIAPARCVRPAAWSWLALSELQHGPAMMEWAPDWISQLEFLTRQPQRARFSVGLSFLNCEWVIVGLGTGCLLEL